MQTENIYRPPTSEPPTQDRGDKQKPDSPIADMKHKKRHLDCIGKEEKCKASVETVQE